MKTMCRILDSIVLAILRWRLTHDRQARFADELVEIIWSDISKLTAALQRRLDAAALAERQERAEKATKAQLAAALEQFKSFEETRPRSQ
jgi:hypothetical protein